MATSKKLKSVPKETPVFDPSKNYILQPNDMYAISGMQLDIINKAIQANLKNSDVQRALLLIEGNKALQEVVRIAVEEGLVAEAPKETATGDQSK